MATEYVNSHLELSRTPSAGSQASSTSGSAPSSATSSGSHRNRQLLKSYHDFAMHVFSNNKVTQEAERLFLAAVRDGDYERVENFLKRRNREVVNIDVKDFSSGDTPLIAACRNGHTKIVQLLLRHGADVTLRNYECETAINVSSVALRKLLLESVERSGCSHRHLLQAAWQGNVTVVRQLLKEGKFLDVNCENEDGFTPLLLVTRDIKVFLKFQTVLKTYKPEEVVRVLLDHRADPSSTDSEGRTPLHHAAASPSSVAHRITLLLMKDRESLVAQDENSVAPIHVASRHGQVEVVVSLLDNGVDINARGQAGATPLHVSASAGQLLIAHTLLDRGADVTLVDDRGNTPMDLANNRKMRATLKEAWTDATQTRRGSTPVLSPVKPPSRRDHRRHSSSEDTSPRDPDAPMSLTTNRVLQNLKDAHQALVTEGHLYRDIDNGNFNPGLTSSKMNLKNHSRRRSTSPSKAPMPPKTPREGTEKLTDGPASSQGLKKRRSTSLEDRPVSSKVKGQGLRGHPKLGYRHSDPTGNRQLEKASIPVTVVGLDWDENVQDLRHSRLIQSRGPPPSSGPEIPKRLTLDLSPNPSLQQITDACTGYLRTRGPRVLPTESDLHQPSLPAVSPSQPLSGSQRTAHFFDSNHVSRTTPSPFMERLHGFIEPDLSAQNDKMQQEIIYEMDCEEENKRCKDESMQDTPLSPLRSPFTSSSFRRFDSSQLSSNGNLQRISGSAAANTFNIESSRVNQLKDSSDSGQGSSRSTNSRASTISTPSPLLGETDGSPSRTQGGTRRSLYLQSVDGESGIHLPTLPRDNVKRMDRVQALEERNFRVLTGHTRHNSEDTMSVVSVSSSVTVKTADICGQRISLSHTLKEESEVGSSPEQTLKEPSKMADFLKRTNGEMPESHLTRDKNEIDAKQQEAPLASDVTVKKGTSKIPSVGTIKTDSTSPAKTLNDSLSSSVNERNINSITKPVAKRTELHTGSNLENFERKRNIVMKKEGYVEEGDKKSLSDIKVLSHLKEKATGTTTLECDSSKASVKPSLRESSIKPKSVSEDKVTNFQRNEKAVKAPNQPKGELDKSANQKKVSNVCKQNTMEHLPPENKANKLIVVTKEVTGLSPVFSGKSNTDEIKHDAGKSSELPRKESKHSENSTNTSKDARSSKVKPSEVQKLKVGTKVEEAVKAIPQNRGKVIVSKTVQEDTPAKKESKIHGKEGNRVVANSAIKSVNNKKKEMNAAGNKQTDKTSVSSKETKRTTQVSRESKTAIIQSSKSPREVKSKLKENLEAKRKELSMSNKFSKSSSVTKSLTSSSSSKASVVKDKVTKSKLEDVVSHGELSTGNTEIKETERKADSGRSQGTMSTPTDVTSDLTSDLYSRDSDSLDSSIEEVLDEVAFSSSSESDLENPRKEVDTKKGTVGDSSQSKTAVVEGKKPKQGAMMLDPAVVVTKTEKKDTLEKPNKLSPKSPKTPKSTGTRKFVFKSADKQTNKKKIAKPNQEKSLEVSKEMSAKASSPIIKKKVEVSRGGGRNANGDRAVGSVSMDVKIDRQLTKYKDASAEMVLDEEEKKKLGEFGTNQVQHTPVIIDIRDDLPGLQEDMEQQSKSAISDIAKRNGQPKLSENRNRKKSAVQQIGQRISKGSAKTSNLVGRVSNKAKIGNKSLNKKPLANSKIGKEALKSPKKGKGKNVGKKENLRIVPDSESNKTAFITGQGWEIKTSRNEVDGVIIQKERQDSREGPSLSQRKLSPAQSLKMDYIAKNLPMSPEVINNIANIMSPLELDTPKFIPDTMDTIKEFAGSLSSVEEEKTRAIFTFSPVGSPNTRRRSNKKSTKVSEGKKTPMMKGTPSPDATTPGSAFLPSMVENVADCDSSDLKTNPELLKVFQIPDHSASTETTPRIQSSREADGQQDTVSRDPVVPRENVLIDIPAGVKDALKFKRKSINVMQKPPLPKFGLSKSQRNLLKRRQSAPSELPSSDEDSSDLDSLASSFRRRFLADIPSEDGSGDEVSRSNVSKVRRNKTMEKTDKSVTQEDKENVKVHSSSRRKPETGSGDDGVESKNAQEELTSSSKEQLLHEHVQTLSIKTLQELNTILSNSEEVDITSPLAPAPLSARPVSRESMISNKTQTTHSLNQSLPMSESSVGFEVGALDGLRPDSRLSAEMVSTGRGTCLSSATSGDRSHSQSTNLSESEGELLHWKKGNVLGKGAFGTVYCGLTSTGQLIAVKQVELTGKHQAGEQYEKLQEEVELLKTLRHKNIVGFLGVSLDESVVNIFMQYIPGGSIASLLARFGALEEPVFCRYTKQVVDGTVYLHSNNVIHRDIKGANIMLMSNGVIKLIDFGCAKRLCIQISQSQNLLKSMKGTPYWMSPEVIMETGHGVKSDVWSIGCTVMEMATRKPPWAEMPPMSAIFAIGAGGPVPQLGETFSSDARGFVDLCLTR
ncbi:uncharacterized protein [Apostichopus japonicus]